tara:strand:+ start:8561 stop:9055 length:495 start_codon:yes stop_codon:yes gene_type:complete
MTEKDTNINEVEESVDTDRSPRSAQSRDSQSRNKPWAPPSALDAPPAPTGFKHRWIRESILGQDDRTNMSKRLREGFEPVRAEEYPDFEAPTIQDGVNAGVIGVGGLILARIPEETVNERKEYFDAQTADAMRAVDTDLMRESDPRMPISRPNRSSKVTFGKGS